MNARLIRKTASLLLAVVLLNAVVSTSAAPAQVDRAKPGTMPPNTSSVIQDLFIAAGSVGSYAASAAVVYSRPVRINFAALGSLAAGEPLNDRVQVNLFDQYTFTAVLDRVEVNPSGSLMWAGHLEGVNYSEVSFVVRDGVLIGRVLTLQGSFEVRYLGDGVHEVVLLSGAAYPENPNDAVPVPAEAMAAPISAAPEVASDDGAVLDLLVVYTTDARVAAGGAAAIESAIELAVADANRAYANSNLNQRVFLTHMEEVAYTETANSNTDLDRLRIHGDTYLDNVTQPGTGLRDTYHADFVSFVPYTGTYGYCGLGYHQATIGSYFVDYAFTWVRQSCLNAGTLPHEVGHNQGARHDWYVDAGTTPHTYAHGYVNRTAGNRWRTIMSYSNACTADGGGDCPRVLYFSNPSVTLGGAAMGVPGGTSTACVAGSLTPNPSSCDADDRQTLNNTAPAMAAYRLSNNTWQGNSTDWNSTTNWSMSRIPRYLDDVTIPAAPTGGNFPVIASDAAVRNVTIANGAVLTLTGGTLTVHGIWDEQGTGHTAATGGTVVFASSLPQTIQANSGSFFNNLQIGDGTRTQVVTLNSNVDVNGNLSIMTNATLNGGTYNLRVGGNWTNNGYFVPQAGSVIFDGSTAQNLTATAQQTVLDEHFAAAGGGGCGCSSTKLPTDWVREQASGSGWLGGDLGVGGEAIRWDTSADAWLFTTALKLHPGHTYQVSYRYRLNSATGATDTLSIWVGDSPLAAAMTSQVSSVVVNSTSFLTRVDTFSVSSEDWYYIGIRGQQNSGLYNHLRFDDLLLTAGASSFYNLEVQNTAQVTSQQTTTVQNNLAIYPGTLLHLDNSTVTIEGALSNNGSLRQTRTVNNASVEFLHIQNAAATTTQYRGVLVNAALNGQNLGAVTVNVRELNTGEYCTSTGDSSPTYANRCFDITPTTQPAANVRLRLYARTADELNGIPTGSLAIYRAVGAPTTWTQLVTSASTGTNGAYSYAEGDTPGFSAFLLGQTGNAPTAVEFVSLTTRTSGGNFSWLAVLGSAAVLLGVLAWHQLRRKQTYR